MSVGGGGVASSSCSGGCSARLLTVYLSPPSETLVSNTMSVDLSALRVPLAVTVVAGQGDRRGHLGRRRGAAKAGRRGQPRADRGQALRLAERLPALVGAKLVER